MRQPDRIDVNENAARSLDVCMFTIHCIRCTDIQRQGITQQTWTTWANGLLCLSSAQHKRIEKHFYF